MLETNSPPRSTGARPRVRFRTDEFDKIAQSLKLETDAAKAEFLNVSPAAFSKIVRGLNWPSADFIAAVRTALPRVPYEQLFEEVRA